MFVGMWYCFIDFLRTSQPIVVGLLAFCGVIVAVMGNSHIARRERDVKILNDKRSLKVALLEELKALKRSMDFRDGDLAKTPNEVYALADDPQTDLFRSSIDKLGLLPQAVLSKVLPAYLSAGHLPKNLRMFQHENTPAELSAHFIVVPRGSYEFVRGMHRDQGNVTADAIAALESWTPTAP